MRTRVKICGITRVEDAQAVAQAGADAIGLVFYAKSPRNVGIDQAAEISRSVPPFITRVALFKDADAAFVEAVLQSVEVDLLQFHGQECAECLHTRSKRQVPREEDLHVDHGRYCEDQND